MDLERFPTSETAQQMLEYVTKGWYDRAYVAKWLYQVMGLTMDQVKTVYDELPNQFFVGTATWGLGYHEQKYGLPIRTELSYEERRKLIYQRERSRMPITPFNLEYMIRRQLGYEAVVSDIHDTGALEGETLVHPNQFLVAILEKDKNTEIHYDAIESLVDKVKQSHTTYTTIHRQKLNRYTETYAGAVATEIVAYEVMVRQLNRDIEKKAAVKVAAVTDVWILEDIQVASSQEESL